MPNIIPGMKDLAENFLEDNKTHRFRMEITSSSSDKMYIVAQAKYSNEWQCSCPGWIFKKKDKPRGCKHLRTMLPSLEAIDAMGIETAAPAPAPAPVIKAKPVIKAVPDALPETVAPAPKDFFKVKASKKPKKAVKAKPALPAKPKKPTAHYATKPIKIVAVLEKLLEAAENGELTSIEAIVEYK